MPRHNHTFSKFLVANADGHGCWVGYNQYSIAIRHSVGGTGSLPTTGYTEGPGEGYVGNENNLETHMNATGGSQPHNNMPPYLVVNIWKRTASDKKSGDANARVIGNFSPSCTYTNSGNDRIITISGLRNCSDYCIISPWKIL